ncbi:ferredoxin [Streptomyces sp. alain-838]|nr:ferredoxin [Streptomyces sp. alain-838]PAK24168.1 ferredoxin [Streptomyces sp. alain-838]
MAYVVAEPCVDVLDRACVDECPVDCIYEGERMAFIQPDECVDCAACVQVCPVEAIYYEDDLPEEWSAFTRYNADFFANVGSPGGTENLPKGSASDPEEVAALPPRSEGR